MSLSYTNHTLEKIEDIFDQLSYKIRAEKGNFKTGACLLQNSKVVVVNKFSNLENKINALVELLTQIEVHEALLNEKSRSFYYSLKQVKLEI